MNLVSCFLAGVIQAALVSSHFTAFPHEHPHKTNFYHNPQPQPYAANHIQYQPQPPQHPEPSNPHVSPHPSPVKPHEAAYHAEPAPVYPHQQPYQPQPYNHHPAAQHPGHYQQPYQYQHPGAYQPYTAYQPYHQPQPVYPVHPVTEPPKEVTTTTPAPPPETTTAAVVETPKYLGTFKNPSHEVEGDIFMLDESTLYIQGFSFDGQAPDAYFWSDGVPIPYYTRADPNVTMNLKKYHKEDVVLMLPPEKPTLKAMGHFQVWCNMFNVVFGEFDMKDAHHA